MDSFSAALELLPRKYASALEPYAPYAPEELRLRVGRAPALLYEGREHRSAADKVEESDLKRILDKATGASLYNAAEAMRQGYYCTGALRIGICGKAVSGGIGFSGYSSLCIRLAHDCRGVCRETADKLMREGCPNTLIVSPPGGGKTTALRDLIRQLADGGVRVGVVDERGELSGGIFELGRCSDVISGLDKLSGALLLLRSMSPQIVAVDEISAPEDLRAIREISGCGVGILATVHARDEEDLRRRPAYQSLMKSGVFEQLLFIRQKNGIRSYEMRECP
ncbi:MAG: stage III sporulation protein AB [Oscillospiraceae bacterium]|nr:stage III sporulation protein AB [Oscillospiraceae bacterium]